MGLSARDQQALDGIEDGLAGSAPKLAAMLATFTRLTSGEEMPADEAVTAVRLNTRGVRRLRQSDFQRAVPALWMLIAIAVLAIALAASRGGSGNGCITSWHVACCSPALAHSSRPRPPDRGRPGAARSPPGPAGPPPGRLICPPTPDG